MTLQNNNITQNLNKRLSVQFSLSGLSFLVTNSDTNEVIIFFEKKYIKATTPEKLLLDLKTSLNKISNLDENFTEVKIIYATSLYSLVPTSLFDSSKASDYLKFNSKILNTDFIAHDDIKNHDITVVYIPFVNINNYLFDRFGDFKYYHSSTILLQHILEKDKSYKLPKVYLHVLNNSFDFIATRNEKLQICNTYEFNTPEDFIYYILFCLEQLKLNPDTIDLYVTGNIDKDDLNFSILYKYIRNVSFYNYKNDLIYTENDKSYKNLLLKLL